MWEGPTAGIDTKALEEAIDVLTLDLLGLDARDGAVLDLGAGDVEVIVCKAIVVGGIVILSLLWITFDSMPAPVW